MRKVLFRSLCAALFGVLPWLAQAGRPLMVDDTGTNEAGHGHVEAWYARLPGWWIRLDSGARVRHS